MNKPLVTLDFETKAISSGLDQFPTPVGLAIRDPSGRSTYFAWGHPSGNNCDERHAKAAWLHAVTNYDVLFHNAKFDVGVAKRHWGVEPPHWSRIHDTMFLVFLKDNLAASYGLKQSAEKYLGMAPDEQDELLELAKQLGLVRWNATKAGHVIADLPAGPVGKYAIGDVVRTYALFIKLYPEVANTAQNAAYNRERELMPILLRRELEGINCDKSKLVEEHARYNESRETAKANVFKILGTTDVNLSSGPELYTALCAKGLFDESKAVLTPTGKTSTAKDNLAQAITNKELVANLDYISTLNTYLDTFMSPWLDEALTNGGRVYPSFSQVRQMSSGGGMKGTKTGRLSAPRFLNTPKSAVDGLPNVRSYLIPEQGHVWVKRDYSQQEYRVLAHYIEGRFMKVYQDNPKADIHQAVADMCHITRRHAKTVGFGLLYGLGVPGLAELLGLGREETLKVLSAYTALMPELADLKSDLKSRYKQDRPINTLGGRAIKADPPGYSAKYKRAMTYDYKLLNYLIQGGSADVTKQAIVALNRTGLLDSGDVKFNITVHDEINLSAPLELVEPAMRTLYEAMLSVSAEFGLDIIMESDGATGPSWGELGDYVF